MERRDRIREDCPDCGPVSVDMGRTTIYHSVCERTYVASLEFECPSPTHPQQITVQGELDSSRSRFVRHPIDTLAPQYQTSQFKLNVRRVYLQNFRSDEQDDPKRADDALLLTEGYANIAVAMYLKPDSQELLARAINEMKAEQQLGTPSQPVRLFDRLRARFKRKHT